MRFTKQKAGAFLAALFLAMLSGVAVAAEPSALKSGIEMGLFTAGDVHDYMQYLTLCKVVLCAVQFFVVFLALMVRPEKESVFGILFLSAVLMAGIPAVLWLLHFVEVGEAFDAVHSSHISDQIRQFCSQNPEISQALGDGLFSGKDLLLFDFFNVVRIAMGLAFVVGLVAWLTFTLTGRFDLDTAWIKPLAMAVVLGLPIAVVQFLVIDDYAAINSIFELTEANQYLG